MLYLTIQKSQSVTLELPDGRKVQLKFTSRPRSNCVRFAFRCDGKVSIRRAKAGDLEGSHNDGLINTINESVLDQLTITNTGDEAECL